jgi:hypothetical protein
VVVFHRQANPGVQAVQVEVQTVLEVELFQLRQLLILVEEVEVLDKMHLLLLALPAAQAALALSLSNTQSLPQRL